MRSALRFIACFVTCAIGAATVLVAAAIVPSAAAPPAPRVAPPAAGVVPPASVDPASAAISTDLAGVAVDGPQYRLARQAFDATQRQLADTRAAKADGQSRLAELQAQDRSLTARVGAETRRKKAVQLDLARIRTALRERAVDSYMSGTQPPADDVDLEQVTAGLTRRALVTSLDATQRDRAAGLQRNLTDVLTQLNQDLGQRAQVRAEGTATAAAIATAASDEQRLVEELAQRAAALTVARAQATVVGADSMSLLAMDAYWRAALAVAQQKPACGIAWWAIAGITRVESRHGTFGGAQLLGNGDTSRPIVGIRLDGSNDTAVIGDTDGGLLDGDPSFDRAVGPMQFIPSTWRRWQADGNGDGTADPNNIYDAAEAAGLYLCASGPMRTDEDLLRGYFSYNRSEDYANAVLAWARTYAQVAIPPPPPPDPGLLAAVAGA